MSTRDDDAALLRALRGATFGPNASVTLPTGETLAGDEMALWVDAENAGRPTFEHDMKQLTGKAMIPLKGGSNSDE